MKKLLSLILAVAMIATLIVIPVTATTSSTADVTISVTPDKTQITAGEGSETIIYTISVSPTSGKAVGYFEFTLNPSVGVTLATNKLGAAITNQGGNGYWENSKALKVAENEDTGEVTGIFETFAYTPASKYFTAYGTTSERNLKSEAVIMTVAATVDKSVIGTEYNLGLTGYGAAYDGSSTPYNVDVKTSTVKIVGQQLPDSVKLENTNVTYTGSPAVIDTTAVTAAGATVVDWNFAGGTYNSAEAPTDAGTYTVTAKATATGYDDKDLTATLTINPKAVEITGLDAIDRAYDGTTVVSLTNTVADIEGVIAADATDVTANIPATGTILDKNAGENKAVALDTLISLSGSKAGNYVLNDVPIVTVNISKIDLTVTADSKTMCLNTAVPTLTWSLTDGAYATGETATDVFDGELATTATGTALGEFDITQGTFALLPDAAANYTLTFNGAKMTVTEKYPVTVNVSISGKTYDGTPVTAPTYSEAAIDNGVTGATPTILYTGTTAAGDAYSSADAPTDAGSYKVTVTYQNETLYGSNYADFEIAKADYDMSSVALGDVSYRFNYTDADKTAAVSGATLPEGVTVKSISYKLDEADAVAAPVEAGTYDVIVAFENANKNYNDPADKTFTDALTINAEKPSNVVITVTEKSSTGTTLAVTITADANGSAITKYTVQLDSEAPVEITEGNTHTFEGLTEGTTYTIKAKATNGVADSEEATVTATPQKRKSSGGISTGAQLPSTPVESVVGGNTDTEEPDTEEPDTEEPSTEEPDTEEPGTEEPSTEEPADVEIVVDPDEEVAVINPAEEVEKDAETGAIVWENTYEDVNADEWYADAVGFAKTTGLMNGVGETSFAPDATLTRGMFVTILYRLVEAPEEAAVIGFKDVAEDAWYADAVNWAAKNGIVTGVGGALFAPDNEVTREQMATMLYRFATLMGHEAEAAEFGYVDAEHVADWAEEAFAWCIANGIINGVSDTHLAPQQTATRAQAAAVFMRTVEFFNK